MSEWKDELDGLLGALREDRLVDGDVARLDQILSEHPEAMDRFLDAAFLRGALETKLRGAEVPAWTPRRRPWKAAALALAAAAALAVALLPRGAEEVPEPTVPGLAVMTLAADVEWESPEPGPSGIVDRRRLALRSGWIQLEFYHGVRMLVEGPADLEILSLGEVVCRRGRLRTFVPPGAEGFAIRTPGLRIVDHGTEFGLWVGQDGAAEVHVFQGRVEVQRRREARALDGGEALRVERTGAETSMASASADFPRLADVAARAGEESRRRYAAWRTSTEILRRDPRLIVHYAFEDGPWTRELRGLPAGPDGAIVGCSWAEGRWKDKGALEFKLPSDRVRFRDAGTYASLTLAAWVRVDGLDRAFSGLMLTDRWDPQGIHWQITRDGRVRAGVRAAQGGRDYDTPPVFDATRLGRWTHLALVYDGATRTVAHYVDGLRVVQLPMKHETPLTLGDAELGNWGIPLRSDGQAIRNLNGRMDEFAAFRAALSDAEIAELHAAGAP